MAKTKPVQRPRELTKIQLLVAGVRVSLAKADQRLAAIDAVCSVTDHRETRRKPSLRAKPKRLR